jgi:hypothetical protein
MNRLRNLLQLRRAVVLMAWSLSAVVGGHAAAAAPSPDESELLGLGFKVMVAETDVQRKWVKNLTPGRINAMQRTGKKFFIYPDAAKDRIFVGGPKEYDAYLQKHPDTTSPAAQEAASRAYRAKSDAAMRSATARDLSDPFLGASWNDFIW